MQLHIRMESEGVKYDSGERAIRTKLNGEFSISFTYLLLFEEVNKIFWVM